LCYLNIRDKKCGGINTSMILLDNIKNQIEVYRWMVQVKLVTRLKIIVVIIKFKSLAIFHFVNYPILLYNILLLNHCSPVKHNNCTSLKCVDGYNEKWKSAHVLNII